MIKIYHANIISDGAYQSPPESPPALAAMCCGGFRQGPGRLSPDAGGIGPQSCGVGACSCGVGTYFDGSVVHNDGVGADSRIIAATVYFDCRRRLDGLALPRLDEGVCTVAGGEDIVGITVLVGKLEHHRIAVLHGADRAVALGLESRTYTRHIVFVGECDDTRDLLELLFLFLHLH